MKRMMKWATCGLTILLMGTLAFPAGAGTLGDFAQKITGSATQEIDPEDSENQIIESGDYFYQVNDDDTITIADYQGNGEELVLPTEIDGKQVTAIGYQAFTNKDFASVSVPEGILTIGSRAFEYCSISDTLTLPEGIIVDEDAFAYAALPETVTIPKGASLEEDSFAYCKKLTTLIVETEAVINKGAFSYSKALNTVICAQGSVLEDRGFEYCDKLVQIILCGEVQTNGDPFDNSDDARITRVGEDEFEQLAADPPKAEEKQQETGETTFSVDEMTFTVPVPMSKSAMPGYRLFLTDEPGANLVGATVFPVSQMDFEEEETVETMKQAAQDYVEVVDAYQVTVSGYPAIWIDFNSREDSSVGVYLYISTESGMYHLLFLTATGSLDMFDEIVESVQFGAQ